MKTLFFLISASLFFTTSLLSQTSTQEIKPVFKRNVSHYISEEVQFTASFEEVSFVGISAFHLSTEKYELSYRKRLRDEWSEWHPLSPQHEMVSDDRMAYEGRFITSPFSALQFKSEKKLGYPLTVRLYVGKKKRYAHDLQQRSNGCDQPEFCDRDCWCPECPIDLTPKYTNTTHIIVHHSAGSNDPNLNFTDVVNYIWDLHVNTNGWDDIGYNWLIDPDGTIYEGRPDGFQGAHFSCINENTVGICLLGNFSDALPTEEAISTLVELAGFEATDHDVDVLGEAYHETGDFNLVTIAGHRDSAGSANACSSTECPGDSFYPMLAEIRGKVADLACYQNNVSGIQTIHRSDWSVSPNPFQNTLTVNNNNSTPTNVDIKDITGKTVATFEPNQAQDLSYLEKGVYLIMHEGDLIEKVIKQ